MDAHPGAAYRAFLAEEKRELLETERKLGTELPLRRKLLARKEEFTLPGSRSFFSSVKDKGGGIHVGGRAARGALVGFWRPRLSAPLGCCPRREDIEPRVVDEFRAVTGGYSRRFPRIDPPTEQMVLPAIQAAGCSAPGDDGIPFIAIKRSPTVGAPQLFAQICDMVDGDAPPPPLAFSRARLVAPSKKEPLSLIHI